MLTRRDAIAWLREEVLAGKSQGATAIDIAQLETQLNTMEEAEAALGERFDVILLERYKAANAVSVANLKADSDQRVELLRSTGGAAQSATSIALAINGGAALALLAFLGHLATETDKSPLLSFVWPLLVFAAGVTLAALTSGFGYMAQFWFYRGDKEKGRRWRTGGILSQLASTVLFVLGSILSALAFYSLG